jgi:hypothetical protein
MRKSLTVVLAVLGVVLVVGALVVGPALAQTPVAGSPGGFHGAMVARAAAILGVPGVKLTDAFTQAHAQALDDAVRAGSLTQAQADWMKQRQQWMQQNGWSGVGMMGGGMMGGAFGVGPGWGQGQGMMGGRFGGPYAAPTPTR